MDWGTQVKWIYWHLSYFSAKTILSTLIRSAHSRIGKYLSDYPLTIIQQMKTYFMQYKKKKKKKKKKKNWHQTPA